MNDILSPSEILLIKAECHSSDLAMLAKMMNQAESDGEIDLQDWRDQYPNSTSVKRISIHANNLLEEFKR